MTEHDPHQPAPDSPVPHSAFRIPHSKNGYRRAIATALAAVSMTVLLYAAILILAGGQSLDRDRAIVLAVFLGLHTFSLTILTGDSPWPHLTRLLRPPPPRGEESPPPAS